MTPLRDVFEKLVRPPEEDRAENLRRWAQHIGGTTRIADLQARKRACAAGVIRNIRIDPTEGTGTVEATFTDGTGQMVAKWLGRPSMAGIRLGVGIVVEGTPGMGEDNELVVLNPEYRLIPGPEHS
ncbi:MAG TPA: hypothetical protein VE975_02565 [Actinomycetota bacterium]|nr:hypothetical protein [Actinomycetota bacterium]